MKSKKSPKGTTRKRSEPSKPRVKDLAPTGRKAKAVKGGFVIDWKGGQGTS